MCKVVNKYVVFADNDVPGYSDIQNAREAARVRHGNTDQPQIIFMAVEITQLNPSPIEFKKVDGVNES